MMDQKWYERGLKSRGLFTSKRNALKQQKNIQKWVRDLETTTVAQGHGWLSSINTQKKRGDCCLGRACYVLGVKPKKHKLSSNDEVFVFNKHTASLPENIRLSLALDNNLGLWWQGKNLQQEDHACYSLSGLNDNNTSFKQIAAFIRGSFFGQTGEQLEA